jgi:hypothetical protein
VLTLSVRTRPRVFKELEVRVDSGAAVTTISAARATDLGIPFPRKAVDLTLETATGKVRQRRHLGRLAARVPGLDGREFNWPCHFVEHADDSPPRAALGLTGVIDDLRITLDGSYALEAPYGWLVLEEVPGA